MKSLFRKVMKKSKVKNYLTVSSTLRDYSNETFFVKKVEVAKDVISKFGYPKELITSK